MPGGLTLPCFPKTVTQKQAKGVAVALAEAAQQNCMARRDFKSLSTWEGWAASLWPQWPRLCYFLLLHIIQLRWPGSLNAFLTPGPLHMLYPVSQAFSPFFPLGWLLLSFHILSYEFFSSVESFCPPTQKKHPSIFCWDILFFFVARVPVVNCVFISVLICLTSVSWYWKAPRGQGPSLVLFTSVSLPPFPEPGSQLVFIEIKWTCFQGAFCLIGISYVHVKKTLGRKF